MKEKGGGEETRESVDVSLGVRHGCGRGCGPVALLAVTLTDCEISIHSLFFHHRFVSVLMQCFVTVQ